MPDVSAPQFVIAPVPEMEHTVYVLSISGGKDSTATMLALREHGVPFRAVFADTGWEAAETYAYLDLLRHRLRVTIDVVGVDGGMVAKIRARAGFPARKQRWCTRELKVEVLRAYHDDLVEREQCETVSVVGIRAEESADRAKMPVFGYSEDWGGYVWRPLRDASVEQVLELHHRHGIPVNPLYRKGFSRVGCNPCIYATKEEIALTAEHFPQRIDQIRALEIECEGIRVARNEETPGRYEHAEATFFQAKLVDRYVTERRWVVGASSKGKPVLNPAPPPEGADPGGGWWRDVRVPIYKPMHIDDVVAWSRTSRGGRQLRVIREEPQGGCFRWGMCEPPTREPEDGTE